MYPTITENSRSASCNCSDVKDVDPPISGLHIADYMLREHQ